MKQDTEKLETIAELRAEVEKIKFDNISMDAHCRIVGKELEATRQYRDMAHEYRDELKIKNETIARQAREAEVSKAVIVIAKRVLYNAGLRPPDGGTPTVETICEDLNDAIKEIAAIERAEGD